MKLEAIFLLAIIIFGLVAIWSYASSGGDTSTATKNEKQCQDEHSSTSLVDALIDQMNKVEEMSKETCEVTSAS